MDTRIRIWLWTLSAIVMLYGLSIYLDIGIGSLRTYQLNLRKDKKPSDYRTKTILFWNTLFGLRTYLGDEDPFENCPETNDCLAVYDRNSNDIENFHAILFHGNDLSMNDLPRRRRIGQNYIFMNLESPVNRPLTDAFFEDYFNLTMTYRLDSDVTWSYGLIEEKTNGTVVSPFRTTNWREFNESTNTTVHQEKVDESPDKDEIVGRNKTKMIAWFVSNCNTKSGRENYVRELSRYIKVDIIGFCGNSTACPRSKNDCFRELIEPNYFFYLSFENSLCQDYVTEKLYNALSYKVVPVVYGGANYSLFAPPNSYVNALDFDSPRELADFLSNLAKDSRKYNEYFRWKKYYRATPSYQLAACSLCKLLHENREGKTYNPLSAWYKSDKCSMEERLGDLQYATKETLKVQT